MRSASVLAAGLFVVASLCPAVAAASCGAEGCPLVRDGFGAAPGRFAFDMRFQDVTQDKLWSGTRPVSLDEVVSDAEAHAEVELFTRTRSWVAEGRARVTDRLLVSLTLPYVQREHRHWLRHTFGYDPQFLYAWSFKGLGDATLLGQYRALKLASGTSLTLQAGTKLPTGPRHVPNETEKRFIFNSTLEPSARLGSGSTDWLAGGLASQRLPWKRALPVTAAVIGRWNGKGTDAFRVGNELQAGLSGGYAALSWLTLLAQVNYSAHGSDVSVDATEAAHSGMRSLFITPGLTARVSHAVSVYGLYQARAWGDSDEPTVVATNHFLFGTTYSLGH